MKKPDNIAGYIATFPAEVQELLQQIRTAIQEAAPDAAEVISYGMPAFKLNGILIYFAAHTNHIGLYPTGSGIAHFKNEFSGYKISKGTVQIPLHQPPPLELITKIVQFRVAENLQKVKNKKG
ncbi:MAG: hypothetical protein JWR12_1520 [Mucilaginibacter sp.]|jgi:uncharacterized protein YdhG (YjbR/CyaY superfamily)|nr:hypothetical protein [Mucilaginibacter sp.]